MPAHVTLLYPYLAPGLLDAPRLQAIGAVLARTAAFGFDLTETAWFGDQVLYLVPRPAEPFVSLSLALARESGVQPYGGAFPDVVPHVTVTQDLGRAEAAAIEAELRQGLPIHARAVEVWLMAGSAEHPWQRLAALPLAS